MLQRDFQAILIGAMSMKKEKSVNVLSPVEGTASPRPLSALLSQILVAFTVEFDNEFERQMAEAGDPGARLSLVVWANLLRFVGGGAIAVRDLAAQAMARESVVRFQLGCLERWRFVVLEPAEARSRPVPTRFHRQSGRVRRAGWGSGRGIGADWLVRLTSRGLTASAIWPPLFDMIERRWERRFGEDEIKGLRAVLHQIADRLSAELPLALPASTNGRYPPRDTSGTSRTVSSASQRLPALLSQVLLTFRLEFDRESQVPLPVCANLIRVLSENPVRLADLPRFTGGSRETSDIGWQVKPYVVVSADPAARRGKVVCLSPRGLGAQETYRRLVCEIEKRWEERFGKDAIAHLRQALETLFDRHNEDGSLLSEGMKPPEGTVRAGDQAPALGRGDVGTAALQRMRDLVAQTELFVSDPAGSLPHYPLWDMNRGFGP